jgi:hypothetical protein
MVDWLTQVFLKAGGRVAGWFAPEGGAEYHVLQGVVAMLLVTSALGLLAYRRR